MDIKKTLKTSVFASLYVQIFTGILNLFVAFIDFTPFVYSYESKILVKLLWIAIFVQIIEGIFYIWLANSFDSVSNITVYRYYDWFITTPTMLFILAVYLSFLDKKENKLVLDDEEINDILVKKEETNLDDKQLEINLYEFVIEHRVVFSMIVILNALMLFFGFSGEMGWIKNKTAVGLGFIPFIAYFYLIYENFAKTTETGIILFWVFTAIWSLYGFSALAPYAYKNISYNILDLISKNLMEVYLSVILLFSIRNTFF